MPRKLIGVGLGTICLLFPAGAGAARLGPDLGDHFASAIQTCVSEPFCTFAQTRLEGKPMRAPFSGRITRWRAVQPQGDLWLEVLRKRPNGSFKAIRSARSITS